MIGLILTFWNNRERISYAHVHLCHSTRGLHMCMCVMLFYTCTPHQKGMEKEEQAVVKLVAVVPAAQRNNVLVLHLLTPQAPRLLQTLRQELYIEMPE